MFFLHLMQKCVLFLEFTNNVFIILNLNQIHFFLIGLILIKFTLYFKKFKNFSLGN